MSDSAAEPDELPGGHPHATLETVEAVVRRQLAQAMGGRRGMVEAAVPTILFTLTWLIGRNLQLALTLSITAAVLMLVVRVVQRSTPQFCINALFGIGIGWFFINRSAAAGGSVEDQALAYFLPGILYNSVYAVVLSITCLIRWPLIGFMVGSVTGELTAWREDPQVLRLCTLLTWVLAAPCALRVLLQAPLWLAGKSETVDPDTVVAVLGALKIAMGWPLQLVTLAFMVWLLARNHTPVEPADPTEPTESAEPAA